jgi:hypothetical protein
MSLWTKLAGPVILTTSRIITHRMERTGTTAITLSRTTEITVEALTAQVMAHILQFTTRNPILVSLNCKRTTQATATVGRRHRPTRQILSTNSRSLLTMLLRQPTVTRSNHLMLEDNIAILGTAKVNNTFQAANSWHIAAHSLTKSLMAGLFRGRPAVDHIKVVAESE